MNIINLIPTVIPTETREILEVKYKNSDIWTLREEILCLHSHLLMSRKEYKDYLPDIFYEFSFVLEKCKNYNLLDLLTEFGFVKSKLNICANQKPTLEEMFEFIDLLNKFDFIKSLVKDKPEEEINKIDKYLTLLIWEYYHAGESITNLIIKKQDLHYMITH